MFKDIVAKKEEKFKDLEEFFNKYVSEVKK